ncbi:MAG: TetR/AcrR family transcriptional regulator [Deltaproteobacteria bacterium]|nr:TetR/AcrR family transcriptional regulator [Deltaproteobacteria bacterium]
MLTKKHDIIRAATYLFTYQGFEGTSTRQIIREAGISDPLLYYHFKSKDDLYIQIVNATFEKYFSLLESLPQDTSTEFEKIENLIQLHFDMVQDMPKEINLVIITCPSKLNDPGHVCTKNINNHRKALASYLSDCLKKGWESGEFVKVPIRKTVSLLIAMINGMLRQRILGLDKLQGMEKTTVEFCRRSLQSNK